MKRPAIVLAGIIVVALTLSGMLTAAAKEKAPRMDVVFLIDTTGSMGDEIEVVKKSLVDMIADIESGTPRPDVRFGLVIYRDRGDEYVTKIFKLTDDTDAIIKEVKNLVASGGGDEPESVNEALHVAIHDINWDTAVDTDKTIFLIGDAPPHFYENDYTTDNEIKEALKKQIIINTIGASGLSKEGVDVFTKIAKGTEGTFEYLTYKGEYTTASGETETVMMSGGDYYAMDKKEADRGFWKLGADKAEEKGLAAKVPAPSGAPSTTGTTAPMEGGRGGAGTDVALVDNNLDSVLLGSMKDKMIEKGVTYGDPIAYDVVYSGVTDYILKDREFTATTPEELKKIITELKISGPKLGTIDFTKKSVIAFAADGNRGLAVLSVAGVTLDSEAVSVALTGVPGKIFASPVVLVAVPKQKTLVAEWHLVK